MKIYQCADSQAESRTAISVFKRELGHFKGYCFTNIR